MTHKPVILDLYCCEGGAARGYMDAGFTVYGRDMLPKFAKRYPGDGFFPGDAIQTLDDLIVGKAIAFDTDDGRIMLTLDDFDAIHASPPCQLYSITNAARREEYPDLVGRTRERLQETSKPWVIENVVGAPLEDATTLCWTMFNDPGSVRDEDDDPLQMFRHRLFESNFPLAPPCGCRHVTGMQVAGSYGGARRDKWEAKHVRRGGYVPAREVQQRLLGIDWMTLHGMHQSIPPCYARHVGEAIKTHLSKTKALKEHTPWPARA